MTLATKDCQITTALVPKYPVCGGKMAMHLRVDHRFVETKQWHAAQQRYAAFARVSNAGQYGVFGAGGWL